jgi:hypothetical protein
MARVLMLFMRNPKRIPCVPDVQAAVNRGGMQDAGGSPARPRGGLVAPKFIMPGLDPGILFRRPKKDRRDKPGDDE